MRISRDKVNKLAHTIADTLAGIDEVEFIEDRNTIRQEARKALEKLLLEETKIDAAARQKIASRTRPDGTPVHCFRTLLDALATIVRNTCRIPGDATNPTFDILTTPNSLQRRAAELIDAIVP